ncbi:MAG TPA: hypothetical protein VE226_01605 [Nitrososphaeraceae archaeon]|jgi:hypothetical protein|nr:hypothetical protein [Nitrososphaeraceae archaeon]
MKIECRYYWTETNIEEDMVAVGILSYPDYSADFIIRYAKKTTTEDKVECSSLAKNVDKDRER